MTARSAGVGPAGVGPAEAGRGPLVVGVGDPARGDDGVGRAVVAAVRVAAPHARVVEARGDAAGLLELWAEEQSVVMVDAVRGDRPAGSVTVIDASLAGPPPAGSATSSHGLGVAEAIALGRVLGRLPERVVVVGIAGERWDVGSGLSPEVAAAVPAAVEAVLVACSPTRPSLGG